jgi:hypothetical protein
MSETFTMRVPAGHGSAFAPGALDRQVGQPVTVHLGDGDVEGTVLAAEVTGDGAGVDVTIEVPDGSLPKQDLPGSSLG